jgi:hypothetical protein
MTTYVFGAGASVHVGYPMAKWMGPSLFAWMDGHDDAGICSFRETAAYLRENYEETEDIEALLTAVDDEIVAGKDSPPRPNRVVLLCNCYKPTLIAAIRLWFAEIRNNEARDYERFAHSIIVPGDCAITFNYDVSLDAQLRIHGKWRLGDGYGFRFEGFQDGSPVRTLKLHGSVNWRFPVGSNGRPLIDSSEIAFLGYSGQSDLLYQRPIADSQGTMILPGRCKQFFSETSLGRIHESFWDSLWEQAATALHHSNRIVICGYSLPEADSRACDLLLREDYPAPIEVCCGGDTDGIVQRLRRAGRNASSAEKKLFDGWLDSQLGA